MRIDVDAQLRVQPNGVLRPRFLAEAEPHVLTFRGETFTLPAEVAALEVADAYAEVGPATTARLFVALFGEEQYDRLLALHPADAEIAALLEAAAKCYQGAVEAPGKEA